VPMDPEELAVSGLRLERVFVSVAAVRKYETHGGAGCTSVRSEPETPGRPEATNGPFLSHRRIKRERRCARVAEFRRNGVGGRQVFHRQAAPPPYRSLKTANSLFPKDITLSPVPPMSAYA
jgi:hypothetical protein